MMKETYPGSLVYGQCHSSREGPARPEKSLANTIPETGEMEGMAPKENLEKGLMGDMGETRTHQSEEPGLLKGPEGEV